MEYISRDRIFGIEQPDALWGFTDDAFISTTTKLRCGIFGFDDSKWKQVNDLILKTSPAGNHIFSQYFSICHDEHKDIVYVVADKGDVFVYDIKTDEWKDCEVDMSLTLSPNLKCWVDNDILYCSDGGKFYFMNIESEKEWTTWRDIEKLVVENIGEYNQHNASFLRTVFF